MRYLRQLSLAQSTSISDALKGTIQMMKKTFSINSEVITAALSDSPTAICVGRVNNLKENYQIELDNVDKELRYSFSFTFL
jgi:hypothetical protein